MPVEVSSRIISLDSRQFIFSIVRDLTERQRAERARLAQIWFMESLDAINRVMQRTGDPQQLMNGVLDSVLSVFKCDRAFLLYASDSGAATFGVPIERYRPEYPGCSAAGVPVPVNEATTRILDAVRAAAGPVQFHANSEYKMPSDDTAAFGIQSVLAMRIQPRTGTECILGLHQCSYSRIWSDEEMRLFQEVGRRLENALTTLLAYQELRESREKLAEAQRIAHIGYWDLDLKNHRISLPEDSLRIFGFSVRQSVFDLEEWGAKWFKIVHPDDQEAVRRFIVKSVDSALAYNTEYRIIRADGQVRHIHSVANVIRDESGKPIRMMGMMQDVTDRKGVEEALRRLTEELEQRVKQRTAELQEQYEELERVNRLFVGRELKMVELKERIKELEQSKDH